MSRDNNLCNEKKTEFLKWQLGYVIDQIKMADNKINFLLAIYLVLLGIAMSQIEKVIGIFLNTNVYFIWKVVTGIICILFLCYIAKFFYCFIDTIRPRTNPKEILGEKDYKSFIFWKDVVNMGFENFKNTKLEELYNDLENQVFINSSIAKSKFGNITSAYKLLIPTLFLLLILFSLMRLIGG